MSPKVTLVTCVKGIVFLQAFVIIKKKKLHLSPKATCVPCVNQTCANSHYWTKITCKQQPAISPKSILIFDEHPLNNNLLGTIATLLSPKDGICIQVWVLLFQMLALLLLNILKATLVHKSYIFLFFIETVMRKPLIK